MRRASRASILSLLSFCCLSLNAFATQTALPPGLSLPPSGLESNLGGNYYGELSGSARVDHLGAGVYEIPIELPQGIGALKPNLSIYYNSNAKDGLLGQGWTIRGLDDKISRCAKTMAQDGLVTVVDYSDNDRFCLNGQRLVSVQGVYGADGTEYRTEKNQFSKITSVGQYGSGPSSFTVETKSGLTRYYGTDSSKIKSSQGAGVIAWALNKVEDQSGNLYRFLYDGGDAYKGVNTVSRVTFNHSDNDIRFSRTGNPLYGWEGGDYKMLAPRAILRVDINTYGQRVNSYMFEYLDELRNDYRRLESIRKCGYTGCPSILNIEWAGNGGLQMEPKLQTVPFEAFKDTGPNFCPKKMQEYPRWHDFDGDGQLDYLFLKPQVSLVFDAGSTLEAKLGLSSSNTTETWISDAANDVEELLFGDINNDGKTDIVNLDKDVSGSIEASISTGIGFITENWGVVPVDKIESNLNNQNHIQDARDVRHALRDINNDGRLDLVSIYSFDKNRAWSQYVTRTDYWVDVYVSLNTGNQFSAETLWAESVYAPNAEIAMSSSWVDINNDGFVDLIGVDHKIYINDGVTFLPPVSWANNPGGITYQLSDYSSIYLGYVAQFKDINKDGLPDRLERKLLNGVEGWYSNENTGKGFSVFEYFYTASPLVPDLNGDGYLDSYYFNQEYANYVHGGNSVINLAANSYTVSGSFSVLRSPDNRALGGGIAHVLNGISTSSNGHRGHSFHRETLDFNNDGKLDHVISLASTCNDGTQFAYPTLEFAERGEMLFQINKTVDANLVSKITNGMGGYSRFEYKSITDSDVYTPNTGATLPVKDVLGGRTVISRLVNTNGIGGEKFRDYKYEGLKQSIDGRGNLGFKNISVNNVSKGITTETDYAQEYPVIGRPTKVERFETASNRLLSHSETEYQIMGVVGSGPVFPYVKKHTQQNYDLNDGSLLVTAITNNTVDTYGNVTATDTATADHETGVTFNNQTNRQYTIDLVNWRVGQLAEQTQSYGINGAMDASYNRTAQFQYNTNGLLNRTLREPGAGAPLELTVDYVYNALGLVTQKTVSAPGVATRSFAAEYDSRGLFPIKVTNALGHETSQTWDYKIGKPLTQTDANGLTTTFAYNDLGGLTQANLPDGTNIKYEMRLDNSGQNPGAKFYVEVIPTGKPAQRTFYDMLGRPIRSRSQSFDGSFVQQDTQYDAQGRAYRVSEPYFVGDSITWNTTSFDALGRVTQINAADNTNDSSLSYDGFKATLTDVNNRQSSSRTDVRGAIVEAIDRAGTKTQFAYNAAGLRTSVTNAVGLTKQFSVHYQYDRLGRMTQQDDPSHGIYTYEYDALGQKLKEVSPKMYAAAQSVQFQYDLLGRMTSRTEPEGTSSWSFDNVAGGNIGIGRLHQESMTGFSRSFEYAAGQFGRATAVNTQILQTQYRESMSYDADGNLDSLTYPASNANPTGFKVRYQYNDLGFVERLTNDGATETYYQMVGADAAGRITQQWLGDGSSQTQAYEVNSNRLSSQQTTAASGTTVQSFMYQYDTSGNMVQRQDVENNLSEVFTFDNLDRLTSAKVGSHTPAIYGFDAVDNIVSKSDVGVYGYSGLAANAVSQTVLAGQTDLLNYDSNGNFFAGDAMPTVTWASYNKPLTLSKDSSSYEFKYGPSRQRYRQEHQSTAGTKITHYVGSNFEVISNGPKAEYRHLLRANGRVVMMRRDAVDPAGNAIKHEYLHRDHLGSITAVTKEDDGSAVATMSYDAWGKRRDATDWNSTYQASAALGDFTRGYTGHEHLDDVGIIHMNGRVYSAELGKMMSPDPVTAEPNGGRAYNRYTYAYNNPLKYVDLNGYAPSEGRKTLPKDPCGVGCTENPTVWGSRGSSTESGVIGLNSASQGYDAGAAGGNQGSRVPGAPQRPAPKSESPEAEEDSPSNDQEDVTPPPEKEYENPDESPLPEVKVVVTQDGNVQSNSRCRGFCSSFSFVIQSRTQIENLVQDMNRVDLIKDLIVGASGPTRILKILLPAVVLGQNYVTTNPALQIGDTVTNSFTADIVGDNDRGYVNGIRTVTIVNAQGVVVYHKQGPVGF